MDRTSLDADGGLQVLARLPDIGPRARPHSPRYVRSRHRTDLHVGWSSIGGLAIVAGIVCGAAWWVDRDRVRPGGPETADSPHRPALRMADSVNDPAR